MSVLKPLPVFNILHSDLNGLLDDDHPQYILVDGSRAFTAAVSGVDPTDPSHLATKNYVDTQVAGGGASEFVDLDDTPADYTGFASKLLAVNATEDAIEFVDAAAGDFAGLTDTPSSYTGEAGKIPRVNISEDALEFVELPLASAAFPGMITTEDWNASQVNIPFASDYVTVTQLEIESVEGETAYVTFNGTLDNGSGTSWYRGQVRITVDDVVVDGGGLDQRTHHTNTNENIFFSINAAIPNLSAGTHVIKGEVDFYNRGDSADTLHADPGCRLVALQFRSNGINGVQTYQSILQANYTGPSDTSYHLVDNGGGDKLEVDIVAFEGERVQIIAPLVASRSNADGVVRVRAVVDGTEVPGSLMSVERYNGTDDPAPVTINAMTEELTAGPHTIGIEVLTGNGAQPPVVRADSWGSSALNVLRFRSSGLGAGSIFEEDVLTATLTLNSSWQDITSIDIDTVDETVLFMFDCVCDDGASTNWENTNFKVVVDGLDYDYTSRNQKFDTSFQFDYNTVSYSIAIPFSSGPHTVKVQARTTGPTNTGRILSARQTIGQFRGGLIPIQDDGVEVVDKPSAMNFKGTGVTVTKNGSVADIEISGTAPAAHADTHVDGGADELDGDLLDITFTPSNYTPDATPAEANDVDDLAAHLKGIDDALASAGLDEFLDLSDTPSSFTDQAGKYPVVNEAEDALEFIEVPNASLGGYQELVVHDNPTSTQTNTNTSYASMSGISQQSFTTPVNGPHFFSLHTCARTNGNNVTGYFRLVIDKGTSNEKIVGDSDIWVAAFLDNVNDVYVHPVFFGIVDLIAGEHTIDVEMKTNSGEPIARTTTCTTQVSVMAQGSGINGLEVVEEVLTSPVTVTTQSPSYQATGLIATFNALENERVEIEYTGSWTGSNNATFLVIGYKLDGTTDYPVSSEHVASGGQRSSANFSTMSPPLSAGQHTVELIVARGGNSGVTLDDADAASESTLRVTRFKTLNAGAAEQFVARESVAAEDFDKNDLTTDSAWHDLDLSGIVPAESAGKRVLIRGRLRRSGSDGGYSIAFRKNGNTASEGHVIIGAQGNAVTNHDVIEIECDSNRIIEYKASNVTYDNLDLYILGWWIPGGGIEIPIQKDGANVVQYPSAINFKGTNASVTDNGGVADVEISEEFTGLTDTPSSYIGNAGKYPVVNDAEDALEFINVPNANLGGYQEIILRDVGNNDSMTSTTYAAVPGISQGTFITPISGQHHFVFHFAGNQSGGTLAAKFRVVIDKGTADEVIVGDNDVWNRHFSTVDSYQTVSFDDIVDLTLGEHTFDVEYKVSANTLVRTSSNYTTLVVSAQGSGINGLEVLSDDIASNFQTSSATYQDTGLSVTFTAVEGEYVQLALAGSVARINTGSSECNIAYQVDSETEVKLNRTATGSGGQAYDGYDIGSSVFVGPLSAGSHTIKIRMNTSASVTWQFNSENTLQIIRHKTWPTNETPERYVDRGDPNGYDFDLTDLTTDGNWHDLDLSSVLPEEAYGKLVHLSVDVHSGSEVANIAFRTNGNSFWPGSASRVGVVDSAHLYGDVWVMTDSNGVVEYKTTNVTFTAINISIRGWHVAAAGISVPIQDDGSNIIDQPSAMNFTGAGATVSDVGGVATINIPGGGAVDSVNGETGVVVLDGSEINSLVSPTNYTPSGGGSDIDSHLEGIDTALASAGGANPLNRVAKSANYQTNGEDLIGCTTAGITITLATADVVDGQWIEIKDESGNAGTSNIIIVTQGSETIDGLSSVSITVNYGILRIYSDGSNWFTR